MQIRAFEVNFEWRSQKTVNKVPPKTEVHYGKSAEEIRLRCIAAATSCGYYPIKITPSPEPVRSSIVWEDAIYGFFSPAKIISRVVDKSIPTKKQDPAR